MAARHQSTAMNMKSLTAILIAAVAPLLTPLYGAAISGSLDGDVTLTPTATPGIFGLNFTGVGSDAAYGAFTPTSTSTVNISSPPNIQVANGMLTETFAHGTLFGTSSGDGTASGAGTAAVTINFLITGGTGFFAGASGDAVVTGNLTATSPTTASFAGSYAGSLNGVPDASPTMAMLAPVVAAVFLGRGRKAASRRVS